MIQAQVIEDSISDRGHRLTTLMLEYPRFIHSEFMTHRMFSRNAASSRAIPTAKLIEKVRNEPAAPIYWGKNNRGMQSHTPMPEDEAVECERLWLEARDRVLEVVENMLEHSPHKQNINRLIEPWAHIQVIVTATEWDNFFTLRDHDDAEPHIRELARAMRRVMNASTPRLVEGGGWHLPFVTEEERNIYKPADLLKMSTARCARVSYFLHDGNKPEVEDDFALHDRLVGADPKHASPTEHQATPFGNGFVRNFRGWLQYRVNVEATT